MLQRPLGRAGLEVSRLALGTMTWGMDTDEHEARAQLAVFLEAGGTLLDTADAYAAGRSEVVLGALLEDLGVRDEVVVATKAGLRPEGPRRFDSSRGHLLGALEASLRRLRTDHVDLWQLHRPDPRTPLEESLQAVDDAVRSGRARYAGVSDYPAWRLARAATWQAAGVGRTPLVAAQVEYSLLQRGVERELLPAAVELGVGVLAWSPLARGVLTGKYRFGTPPDSRATSASLAPSVAGYLDDEHAPVVDAVCRAADGLGVSALEVALAWVRDRPGVVAPVVGARTAVQLGRALRAESLELPGQIVHALDQVSTPYCTYPDDAWEPDA